MNIILSHLLSQRIRYYFIEVSFDHLKQQQEKINAAFLVRAKC